MWRANNIVTTWIKKLWKINFHHKSIVLSLANLLKTFLSGDRICVELILPKPQFVLLTNRHERSEASQLCAEENREISKDFHVRKLFGISAGRTILNDWYGAHIVMILISRGLDGNVCTRSRSSISIKPTAIPLGRQSRWIKFGWSYDTAIASWRDSHEITAVRARNR